MWNVSWIWDGEVCLGFLNDDSHKNLANLTDNKGMKTDPIDLTNSSLIARFNFTLRLASTIPSNMTSLMLATGCSSLKRYILVIAPVSFIGTKQHWGSKGDMNHVFPNVNVEHLLDPQTAVPQKKQIILVTFFCVETRNCLMRFAHPCSLPISCVLLLYRYRWICFSQEILTRRRISRWPMWNVAWSF